jgi:CRP-like cAMP-binding protein
VSIELGIFDPLIRKLSSGNVLSTRAIEAIRQLPVKIKTVTSRTKVVDEGQNITDCYLLVDGYACRYKFTATGGRQIVSFHMAGDILDIQHVLFDRADHSVKTISEAALAVFPMAALRNLIADHPDVGRALWRDCLVEASIFREWVLNVGRRNAKVRIAHMLCEFAARMEAAGLGSPADFTLPMTQEDIGDATGLTPVHVNRMLRELTEEGSITRDARRIRIADWPRMKRTADFSPAYLHLFDRPPAEDGRSRESDYAENVSALAR